MRLQDVICSFSLLRLYNKYIQLNIQLSVIVQFVTERMNLQPHRVDHTDSPMKHIHTQLHVQGELKSPSQTQCWGDEP